MICRRGGTRVKSHETARTETRTGTSTKIITRPTITLTCDVVCIVVLLSEYHDIFSGQLVQVEIIHG